jgi:hypothetical protein
MSLKSLAAKRITKDIKFMGESITISKLTVQEVMDIQEYVKNKPENDGLETLRLIMNFSVEEAKELSDEEFSSFPMDELNKLSAEIMKFSGVGEGK